MSAGAPREQTPLGSYRPFFLGMGHHRPHLPWNSPARFIEQYGDPAQYPVAKQQSYPSSASTNQWHPWYGCMRNARIENLGTSQSCMRGACRSDFSQTQTHSGSTVPAAAAPAAAAAAALYFCCSSFFDCQCKYHETSCATEIDLYFARARLALRAGSISSY